MSQEPRNDLIRDAERYNHLINALKRATFEIQNLVERTDINIDELLGKLLPLFSKALDAEFAFAAKDVISPELEYIFEIVASTNKVPHLGEKIRLDKHEFGRLVEHGAPWLYPPTAEVMPEAITSLAPMHVNSAILVRLNFAKQTYLIGVCNKKNLISDPFLGADRNALDSIVKLIVGGARLNEQHRLESEAIQRISEIATQGDPGQVWLTIAREITTLTGVRYTTLVQVDIPHQQLQAVATWDTEAGQSTTEPWHLPLNRDSMNGFVVLEGAALYIPDTSPNKRTYPFQQITGYPELGIRSAYCMPLMIGQTTIGTIYLASRTVHGISSHNQEIVKRVAPSAAIALQNAMLLDEATKQRRVRQRVIEIQHSIADLRSLEAQLSQICEKLSDYCDTEGFFLATHDPESGLIEFLVTYEKGRKIEEHEKFSGKIFTNRVYGQEQGTIDWVIRTKQTLRVENFATWQHRHEIDRKYFDQVQSCLLTPINQGEQVTGVIGLRSYKRTAAYNHYDQLLLELLSSHIAVVIENARVYEQRLNEQRAINTFQQMISALEVDESTLNESIEPGEIVRKELDTIYPHAQQALHGIGIHTGDLVIALCNNGEKTIRFALVYENGTKLTQEQCESLVYYRTRKIDERKDIVNWIIANDIREPLLLNQGGFAEWSRQHPDVSAMPTLSKSLLACALVYRDKLIGAFVLRDLANEQRFSPHHVGLASMIASQVAIVIGNAQLYELSRIQQREVERALNIAVMGAWEADIAHHINAEAGTIHRELYKLSKITDELPQKVQEHLFIIQQSAKRLELPELHLANPGFHAEFDANDFYERPLIDEVIESEVSRIRREWQDDLEDADIKLAQHCGEMQAHMHELWLRRCLRHFISNAVKYRASDRRLQIEITTGVVDALIHISIRDNGKGITPEVASLLFKQPIPVRPERRHRSSGTGLALVGFVCERFQGYAKLVSSKPNQGSEFLFTTPIANEL